MTMQRALQIIFGISLVGVAFSGTLVWRELSGAAAQSGGRCTALAPGTILGYPPCIYGLAMYLALAAISWLGLRAGARGTATS